MNPFNTSEEAAQALSEVRIDIFKGETKVSTAEGELRCLKGKHAGIILAIEHLKEQEANEKYIKASKNKFPDLNIGVNCTVTIDVQLAKDPEPVKFERVLRGDEFNLIAENAPEIIRALQHSLGVTRGALRDLVAAGGVTVEMFFK